MSRLTDTEKAEMRARASEGPATSFYQAVRDRIVLLDELDALTAEAVDPARHADLLAALQAAEAALAKYEAKK